MIFVHFSDFQEKTWNNTKSAILHISNWFKNAARHWYFSTQKNPFKLKKKITICDCKMKDLVVENKSRDLSKFLVLAQSYLFWKKKTVNFFFLIVIL